MAGWSPNRAVVYYSSSGAWKPDKCPPSKDPVPYCAEEWTPQIAGLPAWQPTVEDLRQEKALLDEYHANGDSSNRCYDLTRMISLLSHLLIHHCRFSDWRKGDHAYDGIGAHGFNVWETNRKCVYQKDGATKTGCNGIDATMECAMKFMTFEASM